MGKHSAQPPRQKYLCLVTRRDIKNTEPKKRFQYFLKCLSMDSGFMTPGEWTYSSGRCPEYNKID